MPILLSQLNGLADSKWSGVAGSVAACVGFDLHDTPGLLKVQQALKKDSGTTVTEFCKVRVNASNGYSFWFSSTTGKIWARSSTGTWTLAYTTVPTGGGTGTLGAFEFNGFIYWATQTYLHRIAIADADDTWASVSANWQVFAVTDSAFHPMAIQINRLFVGDGNRLVSVDSSGNYDNNALDIKTPHRIKCLIDIEIDLLIGTLIATTVNTASVIRWDCESTSWNTWDDVDEVGVNSFIRDDNFVYAQCGRAGALYFYNGEKLEPYKRIPGTFNNVQYGEVYPDSVANFKGRPIFGFSNSPEAANSTGDPALEGVYTLGSYSRDYPKVLDLSFVISQAKTTQIEIGGIMVQDFTLLVAWKDGSNYGVDVIDWANKYTAAYFETRMLFQDQRDAWKALEEAYCLYETLPASTGVTFSYKINHGSYVAMTSVTESNLNRIYTSFSDVGNVGSLQIKVALTVSGNSAPTLEIPLGAKMRGEE